MEDRICAETARANLPGFGWGADGMICILGSYEAKSPPDQQFYPT